jgi:hypothetical protein
MSGRSNRAFFRLRNLVFVCLFAGLLKVGSGGSDLQTSVDQAPREQGRADVTQVVNAGHKDISQT